MAVESKFNFRKDNAPQYVRHSLPQLILDKYIILGMLL